MPHQLLSVPLTALESLKASLQTLEDVLQENTLQARAYWVPLVREGAEGRKQVCINDQSVALSEQPVEVTLYTGDEGARRIRNAFKKIIRRAEQPPDRPDRLPGLIWSPGRATERAVHGVNRAKAAFFRAIESIPSLVRANTPMSLNKRKELFVGTDLQHVFLLQAYRKIDLITEEVESITFGWTGASCVVRQVERDTVLKRIRDSNLLDNTSEWEQRVRRVDDPYFAYVRRQAPFPIYNLRIDGQWRPRAAAALPLVLTGARWPAEVVDLPSYSPKRKPGELRKRGRAVMDQPLIAELKLHRYRPERRAQDWAEISRGRARPAAARR